MNQTEINAYNWLMDKGIKRENIHFRFHKTPDFVLDNGKKYEVKLCIGKKRKRINITKKQLPSLLEDKKNTKILAFERGKKEPTKIIPIDNIYKNKDITISIVKDKGEGVYPGIIIKKEIWKKFLGFVRKDQTTSKVVEKLIKKFIEERDCEKNGS